MRKTAAGAAKAVSGFSAKVTRKTVKSQGLFGLHRKQIRAGICLFTVAFIFCVFGLNHYLLASHASGETAIKVDVEPEESAIVQPTSESVLENGTKETAIEPVEEKTQEDEVEALDQRNNIFFRCPHRHLLPTDHERCDFNLEKDLSYLPNPEYLSMISKYPPISWKKDEKIVIDNIEKLQYPENCNNPMSEDKNRWHLVKLIQAGIGFNIYLFTDLVARHWEYGVPVLINKHNLWRFTDYRCGRGYTCHLKNLTSCDIMTIPHKKIVAITHHGWPFPTLENICSKEGHGKYIQEKGRCLCDDGYIMHEAGNDDGACGLPNDRDKIPTVKEAMDGYLPWALAAPGEVDVGGSGCPHAFLPKNRLRVKNGYLWWHGVVLNYLIRNADNYAKTQRWAVEQGIDHKNGKECIAVHVRHGDACYDHYSKHRTCHKWSEYAEKIQELEERYGKTKTIFIATDDEEVIENARRTSKEHKIVYQRISRAKYKPNGWGHTVDIREDFNKPEITDEFMQDVIGLSLCGMFVGTFTSSVGWITVELQAAHFGHYRPFIALDMPYAHKKNVGRFMSYHDSPRPHDKIKNT